jgi:hypothetical protein
MRRPAAIVILMLLTSCRFYDTGKRVAANAVLQSVVHLQARAPLTQSAAYKPVPAPFHRACRLIARNASLFPVTAPQFLRGNAKRSIERCRSVLPGHDLGKLHERVFVIQFPDAGKKVVRNVAARRADRVCVFQYGPFFG